MSLRIDDSEWPVVTIQAKGQIEEEDVAYYLSWWSMAFGWHGQHSVIIDIRDGADLDNPLRRRLARWLREHVAVLRERRRGVAFVTDSLVTRAAIAATFMVFTPPYPKAVFSTTDEARKWAFGTLGLTPPYVYEPDLGFVCDDEDVTLVKRRVISPA